MRHVVLAHPNPLRSLGPVVLKHLRLYFASFHEFAPGSGLLLALRPILPLGKAEGSLVKLGLALVDGLPSGLEDLAVGFLISFLVEEE